MFNPMYNAMCLTSKTIEDIYVGEEMKTSSYLLLDSSRLESKHSLTQIYQRENINAAKCNNGKH